MKLFRLTQTFRNRLASLSSAVVLAITLPLAGVLPAANADTRPPTGTPATVSADALPTPQINGIVWATALHGNTVYATGKFSVATDITGTKYTRTNLLAFNIATGVLSKTFVHSLSGAGNAGSGCWSTTLQGAQGCSIAVSPDGKRLYVGGSFAAVDGQSHQNFAAINLTTNKVMSGFRGTNYEVRAVAATNTRAFISGHFSQAAGQPHIGVAAYTSNGAIVPGWNVSVRNTATGGNAIGDVNALTVVQSKQYLVMGGQFNKLNGETYYSNGAVHISDGSNVHPWGSTSASFPVTAQPVGPGAKAATSITSLSNDGTQIYMTSYTYISGERPGTFEGTVALGASNGAFKWIDDCEGDTYDAVPIGKVLYSVSHAHDCSDIGGYPNTSTPRLQQHALAETTYATGTNKTRPKAGQYPNYGGEPCSTLLNWFPELTPANVSGASQAAWTITGNGHYIALGGEFTAVNGVPQQGLVRFGLAAEAPNKVGPLPYPGGYAIAPSPADSNGRSVARVYTTSDPDNGRLTYRVYRHGSTKVLATKTMNSRFWDNTSWVFADTGLAPGTVGSYDLTVTDPFGNTLRVNSAEVINDSSPLVSYKGDWVASKNRSYSLRDFGRNLHHTTQNGASASLSFYGKSITLIGEKNKDRGAIDIILDGQKYTVSAYAPSLNYFEQTIFTKSGLGGRRHIMTVTKAGAKTMDIDAFKIVPNKAYDDTSSAITYTGGTWISSQNRSAKLPDYGRGHHHTSTNGAKATFHFYGKSITLIGEKNKDRGAINITLDGQKYRVSAYANGNYFQQVVFTKSGLGGGRHTITVTKAGAKTMDIDAFMVQ